MIAGIVFRVRDKRSIRSRIPGTPALRPDRSPHPAVQEHGLVAGFGRIRRAGIILPRTAQRVQGRAPVLRDPAVPEHIAVSRFRLGIGGRHIATGAVVQPRTRIDHAGVEDDRRGSEDEIRVPVDITVLDIHPRTLHVSSVISVLAAVHPAVIKNDPVRCRVHRHSLRSVSRSRHRCIRMDAISCCILDRQIHHHYIRGIDDQRTTGRSTEGATGRIRLPRIIIIGQDGLRHPLPDQLDEGFVGRDDHRLHIFPLLDIDAPGTGTTRRSCIDRRLDAAVLTRSIPGHQRIIRRRHHGCGCRTRQGLRDRGCEATTRDGHRSGISSGSGCIQTHRNLLLNGAAGRRQGQ